MYKRQLCEVAEKYAPDPSELFYIIGTEVPIPGGETEEPDALDVTSVARFHDTIQTHRDAWEARSLMHVWDKIVSVVTQPGVDFGHTSIYPFEPEKAAHLRDAIVKLGGSAEAINPLNPVHLVIDHSVMVCLLYTSPSPRD